MSRAGGRFSAPAGARCTVSFKLRQIVWMLRTAFSRGPRVVCALANERRTDLRDSPPCSSPGTLQPHVDRAFPLAAVADAHRRAESGKATGAVVIAIAPIAVG